MYSIVKSYILWCTILITYIVIYYNIIKLKTSCQNINIEQEVIWKYFAFPNLSL